MQICYNIKLNNFQFIDEIQKTEYDVPIDEMSKQIVLVSKSAIRYFPSLDIEKRNLSDIKNLLSNGYEPLFKIHEILISQNYMICPKCGADIDVNTMDGIYVLDSGYDLSNVVCKNLYAAKVIECPRCSNNELYYFDLFADSIKRTKVMKEAIKSEKLFLRYRHVIDRDKGCYVLLTLEFKTFSKLFEDEKHLAKTIQTTSMKDLLNLFDNRMVQKYVSSVGYTIDDIVFEYFQNYNHSSNDFTKLEKYFDLKKNKAQLRSVL